MIADFDPPFNPASFITHAQAIASGELVDLAGIKLTRLFGWRSMTCTKALWNAINQIAETQRVRMDSVLLPIYLAVKKEGWAMKQSDDLFFISIIGKTSLALRLRAGLDEHRKPILTLMLIEEE